MGFRPVLLRCVGLVLSVPVLTNRAEAAPASPEIRGYDGPAEVDAPPFEAEPAPEPAREPAPEPEPTPEPESAPEPAAAVAPPGPWLPRHRLYYRNFTAGRVNPLGFVNETTLGYRVQLISRDTQMFRESFALAGAHAFVTPAFVRVGPTVEFQPLAMLNLGATYDVVGTFGAFNQLQSFGTPTAKWGPDDLRRNTRAGRSYATWGHLVTLSALLQLKVKRVAFRTSTKVFWSHLNLHNGDRVYYDQSLDILMPDRGWAVINESDLLYLFDIGLRLVVRHSLTYAQYRRQDFLPGEPVSQPNGPTSRLGPAVAYTFFDRPGVRFNRPTVFLLSQWWLRHRFRTGVESSAAIPYLALGFAFEGDIIPYRKDDARRPRKSRARPPGP